MPSLSLSPPKNGLAVENQCLLVSSLEPSIIYQSEYVLKLHFQCRKNERKFNLENPLLSPLCESSIMVGELSPSFFEVGLRFIGFFSFFDRE